MKFLHLSDLHFHTHEANNAEAIASLAFIQNAYPDHKLIITGDIVDDGKEEQFKAAFACLEPFKGRVYICPGNHDFGAAGNFYSRERAERFDRMLSAPLNQGGTFTGDSTPVVNVVKDGDTEVMLIALDSNLETEHPFDFACGEIGASQLRSLKTILEDNTNSSTIKLLFFHHHPFMVNDPFMELKDAEDLARIIYGRVDLVLFGHKHEMNQWENRWGTNYILASDNSAGKKFAKEITFQGTAISIAPVPIAHDAGI